MKSISRLEKWSFKYPEHGNGWESKTTLRRTLIATNDDDFALLLSLVPCVIRIVNFYLYHHSSLDNEVSDIETSFRCNFCIYSKMLEQLSSSSSWNQEIMSWNLMKIVQFQGNLWTSCDSSIWIPSELIIIKNYRCVWIERQKWTLLKVNITHKHLRMYWRQEWISTCGPLWKKQV